MGRLLPSGLHLTLSEIAALGRGRYVWYGLAGIYALFLGLLLGPGRHAGALEVFLFLVYLAVPAGFAPLAALHVAGPRASRFVQAVFTAPVRQSSYFLAKVASLLGVAALYYAATLPFLALHWLYVGVPAAFLVYMASGALFILFAIAYGLFVGTIFPGRGLLAPVTLSLIPFLLLFGLPLVNEVAASTLPEETGGEARSPRATPEEPSTWKHVTARLLHVGPHFSLMEALGTPQLDLIADHPERALAVFVASIVGLLLIGGWIHIVQQGVESWTDRRGARIVAILAGLLILLLPALPPAMTFSESESGYRAADFQEPLTEGMLVPRGGDPPFSDLSWGWSSNVPVGAPAPFDLVLNFEPPEGTRLVEAAITMRGSAGLVVADAGPVVVPFAPEEPAADGGSGRGQTIRIPIAAGATDGDGLTGSIHFLHIHTNVTLDGDPEQAAGQPGAVAGDSFFRVRADVPAATTKIVVFGGLAPVAFLAVAIRRDLGRR